MPLLLLDLDNTLIDRESAFRRWACAFAERHGEDAAWLIEADADGYAPREQLAERIRQRFGLAARSTDDIVVELRKGLVEFVELDPRLPAALGRARAAGWTPFAVTNGTVAQQERKLRATGLDRELTGWVISEEVGVKKPDPLIFEAAARMAGQSLSGAWMIGDSPLADIVGADRAGLRSVWLSRGRVWDRDDVQPTDVAAECHGAIDLVVRRERSATG